MHECTSLVCSVRLRGQLLHEHAHTDLLLYHYFAAGHFSKVRSRAGFLSSASRRSPDTLGAHADTAPQKNSTDYVRRLIAANGVVMGKTRMHELAYGVTSINPAFGPVLNPYDVTRIPGGEAA